MGEYANFKGERIKIGTCEDLYYLRFDQRELVKAVSGSVDPCGRYATELRWRFPWPDEDGDDPGSWDRFDRQLRIPNDSIPFPECVEHGNVQFSARNGYLVSLPCPESLPVVKEHGLSARQLGEYRIGLNGYGGRMTFGQQKLLEDGRLVLVCRCGGCGRAWRIEEWSEVEPIVVALRAEADRKQKRGESGSWYHQIADRVTAGYQKGSA